MAAGLNPDSIHRAGDTLSAIRLAAVGASATLMASLLVVAAIGAPVALAAAPDHFVVSVSGDQIAGVPFDVTAATAEDASNVADPLYTGGAVLSGLATSLGCSTCSPALSATAPDYGTPPSTWVDGVGTFTGIIAYNAEAGATVTATDGSVSNVSNTFDVTPAAALKGFTFATVGPQVAGASTTVNVTAYDLYGNVNTNYDGTTTAALSGLVSSPGCTDCAPPLAVADPIDGNPTWFGGIGTWTGTTPFNADTSIQLTVADGSISNTSNTFDVDNGTDLGGFVIDAVGATQTAGDFRPRSPSTPMTCTATSSSTTAVGSCPASHPRPAAPAALPDSRRQRPTTADRSAGRTVSARPRSRLSGPSQAPS